MNEKQRHETSVGMSVKERAMFALNRLKQSLKEAEAQETKLSTQRALAHLKTGPSQAVDIIGTPPEPYLEAFFVGVDAGYTATLRTCDDVLPERLLVHGATVWVGPYPEGGDSYALTAYQEDGTLTVQRRNAERESIVWHAGGSRARHNLNLRDFAPYDGYGVETSLAALSPKKRLELERRVKMSPAAFVQTFALLMTLAYALPVLGLLMYLVGLGSFVWQLARSGSLLVPFLVTIAGGLVGLGSRVVNKRLDRLVGTDDAP